MREGVAMRKRRTKYYKGEEVKRPTGEKTMEGLKGEIKHEGVDEATRARLTPWTERGEVGYDHACKPPICPTCHAFLVRPMTIGEREEKAKPPGTLGLPGPIGGGANTTDGNDRHLAGAFGSFFWKEKRFMTDDERRRFFW